MSVSGCVAKHGTVADDELEAAAAATECICVLREVWVSS
jgi:hypothetical protein